MRLIDADGLNVKQWFASPNNRARMIDALNAAPTIDAVPVVHGEWELENGWWKCSACREFTDGSFNYNYCPNCGAKMDGGV